MKTFEFTEASYRRYLNIYQEQAHGLRRSRMFWPPIGAICLVVALLEMTGVWRLSPSVEAAPALLIFAAILGVFPFLIPAALNTMAVKAFRKDPSLREPMTINWDDGHVEHVSRAWSNRRAWSEFERWIEAPEGFLLVIGANFWVVPSEVLTKAEVDEVRSLLQRNVTVARL